VRLLKLDFSHLRHDLEGYEQRKIKSLIFKGSGNRQFSVFWNFGTQLHRFKFSFVVTFQVVLRVQGYQIQVDKIAARSRETVCAGSHQVDF
jgi:hypothetical protein